MQFIKRNVDCKIACPANGKGGGKRNHSCFEWTKLGLSTLVPLMIGIFTVVSYIQQQHISEQRRHQDREVSNDIRLQDRQIADALRAQSQRQADAFHYQDVYKTYLADVSDALFKENHERKFLSDTSKFLYIRSRTLSVLQELDSERQTDLFLFLYETRLTTENQLSFSSLTTNHKTECFRACGGNPYREKPSCPSHLGIKTDFSDCVMEQADFRQAFICLTSFHGATLDYATFVGATIESSKFVNASLNYARFIGTTITNSNFAGASLTYADFSGASITHNEFKGVLLAYANFTNVTFDANVMFINVNLTNMIIKDDLLQDLNSRGKLRNVILPNGTFSTQGNLFVNGDAQKDRPLRSHSSHLQRTPKIPEVSVPDSRERDIQQSIVDH
ncbi:unnamed protein product [Didymodactylos carnosus]|uniref:Pentapeptide repeat-containing protein n=1 Tax=Didymodactylos carnosus TaxID=1234261 RepID=A0A8S2TK54_9BILA|nr:unnamed protein product [Didymodactylos carnosus]CAF4286392.1 unnamed protein product [Didymodactylos carnosus]